MTGLFSPAPPLETQEIGVLLLPDFSNLTLAAIVEPLRAANRVSGRRLYRHRLLSLDGGPVTSSSGLRVEADLSIAAAGPAAGDSPLDLLFLTFEKFRTEPNAYFGEILRFYEIDPKLFASDAQADVVHLRKGLLDEWREVFSPDQQARAWSLIPKDMATAFGWEP